MEKQIQSGSAKHETNSKEKAVDKKPVPIGKWCWLLLPILVWLGYKTVKWWVEFKKTL